MILVGLAYDCFDCVLFGGSACSGHFRHRRLLLAQTKKGFAGDPTSNHSTGIYEYSKFGSFATMATRIYHFFYFPISFSMYSNLALFSSKPLNHPQLLKLQSSTSSIPFNRYPQFLRYPRFPLQGSSSHMGFGRHPQFKLQGSTNSMPCNHLHFKLIDRRWLSVRCQHPLTLSHHLPTQQRLFRPQVVFGKRSRRNPRRWEKIGLERKGPK